MGLKKFLSEIFKEDTCKGYYGFTAQDMMDDIENGIPYEKSSAKQLNDTIKRVRKNKGWE